MIRQRRIVLSAAVVAGLGVASADAALIVNDDFSTFTAGNLVGQNGYLQDGSVATNPIKVAVGRVEIPGGQTVNNQDAEKSLGGFTFSTSNTSIFAGIRAIVNDAPASTNGSSYFLALEEASASAFDNLRLVAKELSNTTYQLGFRTTGQAENPFVFGATPLDYGTEYRIVLGYESVAGPANDAATLYVDDTPYAAQTQGAATGDAAGFQTVLLSQFGSATLQTADVSIARLAVGASRAEVTTALVPEPAALGLVGVGGLLALRRRRRA